MDLDKYYRILGLGPEAQIDEVKKAYRKLALKHHPDLKSGSEEQFKKIVEAYEMVCSHLNSKQERRAMSSDELARFYELLKKAAEEKAREKAFENAARVRAKRAKEQEKSYRNAIYSFLGILIFLGFAYKGYFWFIDWQISKAPAEQIATVTGVERNRVVFEFPSGDSLVEYRNYVRGSGLRMYSSAGMPLKRGDEFRVLFRQDDPDYHKLDTYTISSETFNRYVDLAASALVRYHLDPLDPGTTTIKKSKATCLALLIYESYGLEGLVKCYHFDTHPLERFTANSLTWSFFWKSDEMLKIRSACGLD